MFPSIILTILLTTSATSATIERAKPALRYLKTDFRSSMSDDCFNALILMYFHRHIILSHNDMVNICARKYPRKVLLQNPLSEWSMSCTCKILVLTS